VADLKRSSELPVGGVVVLEDAVRPRTGGWRTGLKPRADLSKCVNCLLCWVYCPDSAIVVNDADFDGFDYDVCKGCEICAEMCPVGAIEMVPEEQLVPERGLVGMLEPAAARNAFANGSEGER
jgi:2-oxoacid:acceptor oxidoreductase delta subunit (pyruvate/2-ketoisovalerate family)